MNPVQKNASEHIEYNLIEIQELCFVDAGKPGGYSDYSQRITEIAKAHRQILLYLSQLDDFELVKKYLKQYSEIEGMK